MKKLTTKNLALINCGGASKTDRCMELQIYIDNHSFIFEIDEELSNDLGRALYPEDQKSPESNCTNKTHDVYRDVCNHHYCPDCGEELRVS